MFEACRNLQSSDTPMPGDTTILRFPQPGSILDPLTEIAGDGARRMLMAAPKAQACSFVARFSADLLADGRQRVVRHGAGPERVIRTGIERSRSGGRRCEIGRRTFQPGRRSALHPISCRNGRAEQKVSMPCLRCFTRAASLPATFRRRCRRSLEPRPRTCRPEPVARRDGAPNGRLAAGS